MQDIGEIPVDEKEVDDILDKISHLWVSLDVIMKNERVGYTNVFICTVLIQISLL